MEIKKRLLVFFLLFIDFSLMFAQQKFRQELKWVKDNNVFEYNVEIVSLDSSLKYNFTTSVSSVSFSIPAGKYRYRIHAYDMLGREAQVSDWQNLEILKAVAPKIELKDKKLQIAASSKEMKIPVQTGSVTKASEVSLVNIENGKEIKGKLLGENITSVEESSAPKDIQAEAVFPVVKDGKWKLKIKNPGGLVAESPVLDFAAYYKEEQEIKESEARLAKEAEEKRKAEEARLAKEAEEKRKAEEARLAKEAEEKRKAEEVRLAKEAEEKRKAEEARLAKEAEEKRKAEEARLAKEAEEKRKAEEARLAKEAEEKRKAEEKRLAKEAEENRKAEEKRLAKEAEENRKAEKKRIAKEADEEKKKTAEKRAEEKRQAEEARLAKEAEEKRKAEEARLAKEAEEKEKLAKKKKAKEAKGSKGPAEFNVLAGAGFISSIYDSSIFSGIDSSFVKTGNGTVNLYFPSKKSVKTGIGISAVLAKEESLSKDTEISDQIMIFSTNLLLKKQISSKISAVVKAGPSLLLLKQDIQFKNTIRESPGVTTYGYIGGLAGCSLVFAPIKFICFNLGLDYSHIVTADGGTGMLIPELSFGLKL